MVVMDGNLNVIRGDLNHLDGRATSTNIGVSRAERTTFTGQLYPTSLSLGKLILVSCFREPRIYDWHAAPDSFVSQNLSEDHEKDMPLGSSGEIWIFVCLLNQALRIVPWTRCTLSYARHLVTTSSISESHG